MAVSQNQVHFCGGSCNNHILLHGGYTPSNGNNEGCATGNLEFKVCSYLEMDLMYKVGELENLERIQLILKAEPLTDIVVGVMASTLEERLALIFY